MEGLIKILVFVIYFIPGIIAINRNHKNIVAIILINLFFGWTFIGWFIALIWSIIK